MRIITGSAKGRRIASPEGENTRPTTDRVKESLFNIIRSYVEGARVLDLFAGTGNLGLEAISRGAEFCVFIERDKGTYRILRENIQNLRFESNCESYNQDAFTALRIFSKRNMKFDLVFLDPPYGKRLIEKSIEEIDKLDIGNQGCLIVSESDNVDVLPEEIGNYHRYRFEKYGRTTISFWKKEE